MNRHVDPRRPTQSTRLSRSTDFLGPRCARLSECAVLFCFVFSRAHLQRCSTHRVTSGSSLLRTERSTYRLTAGSSLLLLGRIFIPGRSPLNGFRQTQLLSERSCGPAAARHPVGARRFVAGRTRRISQMLRYCVRYNRLLKLTQGRLAANFALRGEQVIGRYVLQLLQQRC